MIKKLLFTFSCIVLGIATTQAQNVLDYLYNEYNIAAQNDMRKIADKYCRSNPYKSTFNDFLFELVNDATLKNKEEIKKTDSTLYSFSAFYILYQPFNLKSSKVQVSLWEESVLLIDSTELKDTIVNYLLTAYYPHTSSNENAIKKTVEDIHKRTKSYFALSKKAEFKNNNNEINGGGYNMYLLRHGISPFSVMWDIADNKEEIALHIIFRMSTRNNIAETPLRFRNALKESIPNN